MTSIQSSFQMKQNSTLSKSKKWPTSPPSSPSSAVHRHTHTPEIPKTQTTEVNVDSQTEVWKEEEEEAWDPEPVTIEEGQKDSRVSVKDRINRARARLRKLDSQNPQTPRTPATPQRRQS